jgi:exopolysaccharide biosynthesis polyprenyl glycosylphosphotransferase
MYALRSVGGLNQQPKRPFVAPEHLQSRLLPKSFFLEHAHREYLRALRTKSHVSVVVLSVDPAAESAPVDLYGLSKILQLLLRESDVFGWYAENAVAVLVADSDDHATKECAERILERTAHIPLRCEIRRYPDRESIIPPERDWMSSVPSLDPSVLVHPDAPQSSRMAIALKRAIDIFGSITGLVLFSPIMAVVALAIKATSPGPIIFKQIRVGQAGVPFVFFKFRSMRTDSSEDSHRRYVLSVIKSDSSATNQADARTPFGKMKADPRITRVGRLLRKSSIDELPQFFNVLRGDMSLVGPRPSIPYEVEAYGSWHLRRVLHVKPGITGLWQVEGRSVVSFDDMVRLDLQYARHWSILLDLKILLRTAKVVLQCRGAD